MAGLAPLAAPAAERDILDVALEHPMSATVNDHPVRFGDPALDSAEIALRNYLPRPWTATRIHALFLAAYTRLSEAQKQANDRLQDQFFESMELVEQLGTILAASRDPRAALALGRVIESPDPLVLTCGLARNFMQYFLADTSYQSPATEAPVIGYINGCTIWAEYVHRWWLLNQREVEQRAAAITAGLAPCANCEQEALATIDQLRTRIHDSVHDRTPTLHMTVEGAGVPRDVAVSYVLRSTSGQWVGAAGGGNGPYTSPDFPLRISGQMLDRNDLKLSGVVLSTGYRSVPFELDRINDGRVVPIKLVPVPSKTLTGTVTFSSDSAPRPFRLLAGLRDVGTRDPSGASARVGLLVQNVDEVTVDEDGHFSITVPDVTKDPILNIPGNHYELAARNSDWVLVPDVVALDHPPGTPSHIIVAPRPGTAASANTGNAALLLPVTGREIDAEGRPVSAGQTEMRLK